MLLHSGCQRGTPWLKSPSYQHRNLYTHPPIYLPACLPACLPVCFSVDLPVLLHSGCQRGTPWLKSPSYQHRNLSTHPPIYLPACLPACLHDCLLQMCLCSYTMDARGANPGSSPSSSSRQAEFKFRQEHCTTQSTHTTESHSLRELACIYIDPYCKALSMGHVQGILTFYSTGRQRTLSLLCCGQVAFRCSYNHRVQL